ncbi:alpha-L-glutamate ligase [Clostridium bovifaecis]|uniref:Alpha-L-glutamate ligase n=1 Tax=Clostridium bovifaecis TaxID=2184719 RepID=A0A6I6F1Q1_9CLOT|nr:alpha-L-glutamate ligase [Clostridium bovifaecis]
MEKIYIIHENNEWVVPLRKELEKLNLPYEEWHLDRGVLDLLQTPPKGVFYNRMSASSHTRDHRYAAEYAGAVLSWLESHGRKVINKGRALQLEISKVAQYASLNAHGILTPRTIAAVGKEEIIEAAKKFEGTFITKHNRGGKGLGVQKFENIEALKKYVYGTYFDEPIDGITLIQQYVEAPEPFIIRSEFIGGKFYYAVKVNTSEGFQLCPADACQIGDAFCPVGESRTSKFTVLEGYENPLFEKYERFLAANDIHIAGIEFIIDKEGTVYTYDVNTNTNYNSEAEEKAGVSGMGAIAKYLGEELEKIRL